MRALSRKTAYRKSTLRNLATSLFLYERIKTTTAKAKELKPVAEHLLAVAKGNDLNSRRRLLAYLFDENAVKKVIEVLVPRYKDLSSGFIKSYRLGTRLGDGAEMSILELVDAKQETKIEKAKNEVKKAAEPAGIKDKNDAK